MTEAPISRYFPETTWASPAAQALATHGKHKPMSTNSPAIAASSQQVPSSLAGLPAILDPLAPTSLGPGSLPQTSQEDADIRTLLHTLPTKADMEALVQRMEEQNRHDFQQLHTKVQHLDVRFSKGESSVSSLEKGLAETQIHIEDLENRSRRNNLRLRGLPEATGPENLQETVRAILLKVLDPDPSNTLEFDRVSQGTGTQTVRP